MLAISKVTSKYQTSIPKEVRKKLNITAGDYVEFDIEDKMVVLKKINKLDKSFLKLMEGNIQEWNSKEDEEQFSYLGKFIK